MDTIKSSSDLKINWEFADGDTRLQKVPNPKNNLTTSDLKSLETLAVNSAVLIGDKTGAALTGIKSASIIDKSDYILDLS